MPGVKDIVLCDGVRTPIGHFAKSLSSVMPETLLETSIGHLIRRTKLNPETVDGIIIGWVGQGSHAPNIARMSAIRAGLPEHSHAITIQCNCISGMEAISIAAKNIITGEGDLFIAGGTESMSTMPFAIRGSRADRLLRSMDVLKEKWPEVWNEPGVTVKDCIEEGLTDPVKGLNMAQTAEVCAQRYGISREEQDEYTAETFRRCYEAEKNGFYATHVEPFMLADKKILEKDEYIMLREKLVKDPSMIRNAPVLFQRNDYPFKKFYEEYGKYISVKSWDEGTCKPTVTLFNSCARSDAAAVIIVTNEKKAKELNLPIIARLRSWSYWGFDPARMGVAPAYAAKEALDRAELDFNDLDNIELHEAFAASVLSAFHVGEKEFGHKWRTKWEKGDVNPNGGSISLGHPLAATGTRLLLNLAYKLKADKNARIGMAAACASGGIGGAMIIEKY